MREPKPNPCRECPWKRKSLPGWLGASSPEQFVATQEREKMPCHLTVDYEDPDWELLLDDAPACTGGLQFLANSATLPYDREMCEWRDRVGKNPDVFSRRHEFIDHHRSSGVGSWELP